MEPWAAAKKVSTSVAMSPAPVLVPSQWILAPNVTSLANYRGDNEMTPRAVHKSTDIYLTAEENP